MVGYDSGVALPVKQKTWVISPNNRITFVSLLDTMQRYLHGAKTFLKANGYTVKGSASAGTGAMDGVDRWTATTDVTPRATIAGASQAWLVLVDGNGVEILIAYQGASDDICRISICADGTGFSAAGTPNQQPTSSLSNEQILTSATSTIGAAGGDRLWNGWVDSQHKLCRFGLFSGNTGVGKTWAVELTSPVVVSPVVFSPPVWGFSWAAPSAGTWPVASGAATAGVFRCVASSVSKLCTAKLGMEVFGVAGSLSANIKAPAQGGAGYLMQSGAIATDTAGAEGKYANLFDQWYLQGNLSSVGVVGDTLGTLEFIFMGTAGNGGGILVWPWDGVTTPVLA